MLQKKIIDQAMHHVQDSTKNRGIPEYDIDFRLARPAAESRCIIVIASAIALGRTVKVQSALKRDTNERRRCNRSSAWGRLAVIG